MLRCQQQLSDPSHHHVRISSFISRPTDANPLRPRVMWSDFLRLKVFLSHLEELVDVDRVVVVHVHDSEDHVDVLEVLAVSRLLVQQLASLAMPRNGKRAQTEQTRKIINETLGARWTGTLDAIKSKAAHIRESGCDIFGRPHGPREHKRGWHHVNMKNSVLPDAVASVRLSRKSTAKPYEHSHRQNELPNQRLISVMCKNQDCHVVTTKKKERRHGNDREREHSQQRRQEQQSKRNHQPRKHTLGSN